MPPAAAPLFVQTLETPLGALVAGARDEGVCLLEFPEPARLEAQLAAVRQRLRCEIAEGAHPHLDRLRAELAAYFSGSLKAFSIPLVVSGTPFQERVWRELRTIPFGSTRSYEDIARSIGARAACRAVGRANGMNPLAIVVPCHRVINKSGTLGGYGGQLWRKEALLRLEGAVLMGLFEGAC
jgi:AraC family transcriptional regulator of adaptative response/methylated-DNA-[protein]-cysteine methyltransferase